jgi:hypothetical protein
MTLKYKQKKLLTDDRIVSLKKIPIKPFYKTYWKNKSLKDESNKQYGLLELVLTADLKKIGCVFKLPTRMLTVLSTFREVYGLDLLKESTEAGMDLIPYAICHGHILRLIHTAKALYNKVYKEYKPTKKRG